MAEGQLSEVPAAVCPQPRHVGFFWPVVVDAPQEDVLDLEAPATVVGVRLRVGLKGLGPFPLSDPGTELRVIPCVGQVVSCGAGSQPVWRASSSSPTVAPPNLHHLSQIFEVEHPLNVTDVEREVSRNSDQM
jgi:hypothetical protein